MADSFLLKGKVDEYQNIIDLITGQLNDMDNLKGRIQTHVASLDTIIDESDANFDQARDLCEQNVVALEKSIHETEKRRDMVQETLTEMEGISDKVQSTIAAAADAAKEGLALAANVAKAAAIVG